MVAGGQFAGLHLSRLISCIPFQSFICIVDQEALLLRLTEKRKFQNLPLTFSPATCLELGLTFGLVRGMPIGTSLL
jgi:hypothetical protein